MITPTINPVRVSPQEGQCHYFVTRKKRFCRMTVRPGRQYCGEHEPKPKTDGGQDDTRIPCPLDSKHTCYASKLEKHLSICNAKKTEVPDYIVNNINAVTEVDTCPRKPLNEIPTSFLEKVIKKIDDLFTEHIVAQLTSFSAPPIHGSLLAEFTEPHRSEKSLRHLRQVSSLLHIAESEGLVRTGSCYVELGAGKGQLSYYLGVSWCQDSQSRVLSVDRAALRHKRDNLLRSERLKTDKKLKGSSKESKIEGENHREEDNTSEIINNVEEKKDLEASDFGNYELEVAVRIRADLAHLALSRVPVVKECERVVGFAKHLCGVAMDYALRCLTSAGDKCRGAVLATCCHHRCERPVYVASHALQKLGISPEEFNVMLSVVSWATCGDGRSRELRKNNLQNDHNSTKNDNKILENNIGTLAQNTGENGSEHKGKIVDTKDPAQREQIGRKAKLLIDWGRVLYLRENGFTARLCHYVPSSVSLENVCIIVKREGSNSR